MSNTGFTPSGYNYILRISPYRLRQRDFISLFSDYIGMPEWKLTKDALIKICGTAYAVKRGMERTLAAGYLEHYTARYGFRRIYSPIRG